MMFLLSSKNSYADEREMQVIKSIDEISYIVGEWNANIQKPDKNGWKTFESSPFIGERVFRDKLIKLEGRVAFDETFSAYMSLTIGYDSWNKVYRIAMIDDVYGLIDVYEGGKDKGRLVLTNIDTNTSTLNGSKNVYGRMTIVRKAKDKFEIKTEVSIQEKDKWQPYLKLVLSRKKKL